MGYAAHGVHGFGPMFQGTPQMPLGQAYPPQTGGPQQPNQGIGTPGRAGSEPAACPSDGWTRGRTGLVAQQGVQLALQQELEMNLLKLQQVISESQQIAKKLELILGEVSQGTMQDAGQGQEVVKGEKRGNREWGYPVPDTTQDLAAPPEPLQGIFGLDLGRMKAALGYGQSFDIAVREFRVGNRNAALIMVDGFSHDLLVQQVMISLMRAEQGDPASSLEMILARDLVFAKINPVGTIKEAVGQVLMGRTVLLVDGALDAVAIDMRTYPGRNPEEPDLERVIRGSRDGFVETVMFNVALIRRRLRDPRLRFELQPVGRRSQTDVVVAYLQDVADPALVQEVRSRLRKVDVDGLPMAEKSLEEFILEQRKWWNPYPTIRYTERPDVTAVHLLEGHVAILVDTSPSVMLLPVTIFHHIQHAEEYRQDVLVGAYLRWVRTFGIFISAFITPVWILLAHYPELMPALQGVIGTKGQFAVRLQFFLAEHCRTFSAWPWCIP